MLRFDTKWHVLKKYLEPKTWRKVLKIEIATFSVY